MIVTLNVPAVVDLQDRVAVPEPVTLVGVTEQTSDAGAVVVSATVPENPLRPATVIVEDAVVVPSAGAAPGADALIVKSTTWNRIDPVEWLSVPETPVTVAV